MHQVATSGVDVQASSIFGGHEKRWAFGTRLEAYLRAVNSRFLIAVDCYGIGHVIMGEHTPDLRVGDTGHITFRRDGDGGKWHFVKDQPKGGEA